MPWYTFGASALLKLQARTKLPVTTRSSPLDINIVKRKSIRKSATTVSTDLADERCPSGVEGLDDILAGGLPRDCFYLVQGDPGSGKTTLALQFLLEGATARREGLLYHAFRDQTGVAQSGAITRLVAR